MTATSSQKTSWPSLETKYDRSAAMIQAASMSPADWVMREQVMRAWRMNAHDAMAFASVSKEVLVDITVERATRELKAKLHKEAAKRVADKPDTEALRGYFR